MCISSQALFSPPMARMRSLKLLRPHFEDVSLSQWISKTPSHESSGPQYPKFSDEGDVKCAFAYPPPYDEVIDSSSGVPLCQLTTVWYRNPATHEIIRPVPDMEELTRAMAKMSLYDSHVHMTGSLSNEKICSAYGEYRFNPIIIRPYPAPLPSLVQPASKSHNGNVKPRRSAERRKPLSRENAPKRQGRSKAKPSQLPKRLPSTLRPESAGVSAEKEARSEAEGDCVVRSSSRSLTLSSRTPSMESLPGLSRSASESSSSSDGDSPLLAPSDMLPEDVLKSFFESDMFSVPEFDPEAYLVFPEDSLPEEISIAVNAEMCGSSVWT